MRPGTAGAFSKVVPPQGEVVQGKFIPGGTLIAMNVPAMLRSAELFGSDANLFRPERWLEASEAKQGEMERQVEMMFGHGRLMCAGKPIAFMELFKTFFEVSPILVGSVLHFMMIGLLILMSLGSCSGTSTLPLLTRPSLGTQGATMSMWRITCGFKWQRHLSPYSTAPGL